MLAVAVDAVRGVGVAELQGFPVDALFVGFPDLVVALATGARDVGVVDRRTRIAGFEEGVGTVAVGAGGAVFSFHKSLEMDALLVPLQWRAERHRSAPDEVDVGVTRGAGVGNLLGVDGGLGIVGSQYPMPAVAVGAGGCVCLTPGQGHTVQAGGVLLGDFVVAVGAGRRFQLLIVAVVGVGVAVDAVHAFVDRGVELFHIDEDGGAFPVLGFADQVWIGVAIHANFVVDGFGSDRKKREQHSEKGRRQKPF